MNLRRLLLLHAIVTFAAGIVLIVMPEKIPATVNIRISPETYLLCYFLGAAELALAFLSLCSRSINDKKALRLICITFILFHLLTAAVEILAFTQGLSSRIWANVALRALISLLFFYYSLYKIRPKQPDA